MAFDLSRVKSGKDAKPPRIIAAGVAKIGKSTFLGDSDNPFMIPIVGETGVDEIAGKKTEPARTYDEVMGWLEALATQEHQYKTVGIDSLSTFEPLVWAKTCKRYGVENIEDVLKGYGKGYSQALQEWSEFQAAIDYLRTEKGIGCILIAHVKVKNFNDPLADPYDQYQLDLQAAASEQLSRWADCILFANFKNLARTVKGDEKNKTVHAISSGERYLYTQKRAGHPGGCRRNLPYEIPFSYASFAAEYAKATAGVPTK